MANLIITISVILILVFAAIVVLFLSKAKKIKASISVRGEKALGAGPEIFNERWQAVLGHLNSVNESEWKLAIIEADKIIDDLLIQKGCKGESMAERLSLLDKKELRSLDLLWEVHKVRNRIVHKLGFKINRNEALRAISYYGEALKELQTL